ncbi:protein-disulfide reductase DsbD domain-containing protein, partial [Zhouia sp. PK063]|uniref:protein-disulfide reductase DsbD n=1 Tax=Zhouia sp. PK063 TaxID=3373602 RepID=UPI00378FE9E5
MKKLRILILLLLATHVGNSQILDPVSWSGIVNKNADETYSLVMKAQIEAGWHLYSQKSYGDEGPIPTTFTFLKAKETYQLQGKTAEEKGIEKHDETFDMDIKYFEDHATFTQKIQLLSSLNSIAVEVNYMVCNDHQCLPPETKTIHFVLPDSASSSVSTPAAITPKTATPAASLSEATTEVKGTTTATPKPELKAVATQEKSKWGIFLGTLLAGILVIFTPCVFPMIPMTVSFFIKQNASASKGKFNALFYGISIILIYVLISLPFHLFESLSPDIFNAISTNVYLNIFFFVVFVVFAISFFGAFEITMPNAIASKADKASGAKGLLGIFFMALTL